MTRVITLVGGLIAGTAAAGIAAGLLIPRMPPDYRSEGLVWIVAGALVALFVGLAFLVTRPRRS